MLSLRILATVVAIGGTALIASSCENVTSPCTSKDDGNVERAAVASGLMDGTWVLATINGSPIPDPGYQVAPGQFIRAGFLHFRTDRLTGGCDEADDSAGRIIVQFVLVDGAGISRPGVSGSGGFEFFPATDAVRVKAFDREVTGESNGTRFVVSDLAPARFPDLQLEFRR